MMLPVRFLLGLVPGVLLLGLLTSPTPASVAAGPATATRATTQVLLETGVIREINRMRARKGCRALVDVGTLHLAARRHSNLMASRRQLSHRLAGEATLQRRVRTAGYSRATMLGEVLGVGARRPVDALRMWMHSPRHRALISDCRFRHIGTGVATSRDGRLWWTVDLGRR
jgi:uncharacterized protein YkwD